MRIGPSVLMMVAVIGVPRGVAAQSRPNGDAGSGESYEQLLKKGEAAVIDSDWKACVHYFERARALRADDPLVYLAIGRCSLEDGDNVRAVRNLQEGIQRYPLEDKRREKAESLLERARQRVGAFTVELSPREAEIKIADQPLELDDKGRAFLEAGRHPVTVSADGYQTLTAELEVKGGESKELIYVLQKARAPETELAAAPAAALPAAASPASTADSASAPGSERAEDTGGGFPLVPVVVAGVGGAMLIGAAVTGVMALVEQSELEQKCRDDVCDPDLESTKQSADTLATVTDVLWVAGVLTVGTGVVLHFVLPGEPSESASVTPVVGPSVAGLCLDGRF